MTMQAGVCVTNGLFIVNDGVDKKDFEKFVKDEWAQTANTAKGITCHVAKADRGDRETGHYMARKAYLRKDEKNSTGQGSATQKENFAS